MQKNWVKFYENKNAPLIPSTFAKFIMAMDIPGNTLVELGSGNGRDAYLLGERYKTLGVDPAVLPDRTNWVKFIRAPWQSVKSKIQEADIVYSRFFLHAIPREEVAEIIRMTPKYFIAEARTVGDKPELYPEHERNFVDRKWLLEFLEDNKFVVHFYQIGRGLAPYKNEDPLLIRVIAKRT